MKAETKISNRFARGLAVALTLLLSMTAQTACRDIV